MKLEEYTALCEKTKMTLPDNEWHEYLYAGYLGEVGELLNLFKKYRWHGHEIKVNDIKDELGDVLWHLVQIPTANLRDVSKYFQNHNQMNKENDDAKLTFSIDRCVEIIEISQTRSTTCVIGLICELGSVWGLELEDIMEYNVEKLRKRYPDGFSKEASVNRVH